MHGGYKVHHAASTILRGREMACSAEVIKFGLRQLNEENYPKAFNTLLPCAEAGDVESMAAIGLMCQLGLGVDRNIEQAILFLQKAAEEGSGPAAHNLGTLYLTCEPDIPRDPIKSKFWYERAKSLGFVVGSE